MLSEDSAPRSQPVLNKIVVELQHDSQSELHLPIRDEKGKQLAEVKDHLNDDWNSHWDSLFSKESVFVIGLPWAYLNVLHNCKENDKSTVDDSDDPEGYVAVQSRLLLLHHCLNFDHTFVIRDKSTEEQEANGAHKGCNLENDHGPVLVVCFKRWRNNVPLENKSMTKHDCEWLADISNEAADSESELEN